MKIEDFTKQELYAIADKFGVDVEKDSNKAPLVKAIEDNHVTPELVFEQIPEFDNRYNVVDPDELRKQSEPDNVVRSQEAINRVPEDKEVKIITQEEFKPVPQEKYLIKMDRQNHYFEVAGYTFTKDHPYALVDAEKVNQIVREEEGFRIATPDELQNYYN